MGILAFDTSNYTTSVAYLEGEQCFSSKKLLEVPSGSLGLRQQEALFQHIKMLPVLLEQLKEESGLVDFKDCSAIAVSTRPRERERSYMPCFLAGEHMAKSLSTVLKVPCYKFSHQQGHLVAGLWALDSLHLLEKPFLAWHISGGTTELLYVTVGKSGVEGEIIGHTSDISAGQLIDRTGQLLGLAFPSGKAVDALAVGCTSSLLPPFSVKHKDLTFSLSGMENKVQQYQKEGVGEANLCAFVLDTIAQVLGKVTEDAQKKYGKLGEKLPVLYCGGVASSVRMQKMIKNGLFPPPIYATDNAVGVAVLGNLALCQELAKGY